MRRLAAALLVALFVAAPAVAQRAPSDYRQTDAVLAHYPALKEVPLQSPAFVAATPSLTSQDDLAAFVTGLARSSRHLRLASLGHSQQGRDLPLLYFTQEGLDDPAAIARLGRPVIWLIGQQHGNEPAGGEAMLAVAAALSSGELEPLLARLSVVIVPRGNPDGAAADRRVLASGSDLNRDHLLLSQPETRALHAAMRRLPPDVVIDHHEFSVAWRWVEKFGAMQAVDVMILEATHPGVPKSLTEIAHRLYRPALEAAMDHHGLSSHDYVTTGADMDDRLVSLGGNAPAGALAQEWMMDNPDCRVRFHDWWRAPQTMAQVRATDPVASHGSWLENFPWTRLPSTPPDDVKEMVDTDLLKTLPPFESRNLLEDGNFGGRSQRPDAEMLAIWRIGVEETRAQMENW